VTAVAGHHTRFDASGGIAAVDDPAGLLAIVDTASRVAIVGCLLSFVAAQVLTWRRADGDRRQQLKWLLTGAVAFLVSGIIALSVGVLDPTPTSFVQAAVNTLSVLGWVALPVGMGVAILRYRLYDVDRIISRTLAYAIVTVQRQVDRRFHRARYNADRMLSAFAARLQDTTDADAVRSDLIGTVHHALEPAHLSLWLTGAPR